MLSAAAVSFFLAKSTVFAEKETPSKIIPVIVVETKLPQPKLTDKELTCIADMAWHEARGEGIKGITAVIHVALNRKESRSFPNDVCGIVYQRVNGNCQYSWVCQKTINGYSFRRTALYGDILLLAKTISSVPNRFNIDPTRGSLYFTRHGVASKFFRQKLIQRAAIGNHQFYAAR